MHSSSIKQKWYIRDWVRAHLKGISKLQEEAAQMSMGSYSCYTAFLSSSLYLWLHGEFPEINSHGREDLGLVYKWVCTICRTIPKWTFCSTIASVWDILEGQWWREIPPMNRTTSSVPGYSLCLEEGMTRYVITYWFMGYGQWFGWMVRDLEGRWLES